MSERRKRPSGAAFRKRKQSKEAFLSKQEGALPRYRDTNVHGEPSIPSEDVSGEEMPDLPVSQSAGDLAATAASISPSQMDVTMHMPEEKCRSEKSVVEAQETAADEFSSLSLDDPGLWTHLSSSLRDFLVLHGPQQVKNFMFPKDNENRSFHPTHSWCEIPNGDKVERSWLRYSKPQNTAYCFCCKLLQSNVPATLRSTGTKDWKNLARNVACHEKAANHQRASHRRKELEMSLRVKSTIDDQHQEKIASESLYWQNVLKRLIAIVRMLLPKTQHCVASDQLHMPNNGNFLKIVGLMAEFDAIVVIMEDNAMTGTVLGRTVAEGNGITRNIHNFKFLCGLVLWHDRLFEINVVSKRLQGVDLDISGAMEQLDKAKSDLQSDRSDEGFQTVLKSAQKLAEELHTEAIFPPIQEYKSHRRRRHFDYEAGDNPIRDPKLKALSSYISAGSTPKAVLEYMCTNKMTSLFPNAFVALHILLSLPVTVATGERSFSTLKLIKTRLHSTMTQVSLASISIERELAQTVDMQEAEAVQIFATKKARKTPL